MEIKSQIYPVRVNIMTYKDDATIIEYCIRSIFAVFRDHDTKVFVYDDSNHPMDESIINNIKDMDNVYYEQTTFERNKNLNGRPCIAGMLELFKKNAVPGGLNIKIDPDTILLHSRCFNEFMMVRDSSYMCCLRPGSYYSGMCYAFKSDVIDNTIALFNSEYCNIPDVYGPEDYFIGTIMSTASLPKLSLLLMNWNDRAQEGAICGWNYKCPNDEEHFRMYYQLFQFVSVGNWFKYPGLTKADRVIPAKGLCEMVENTPDIPGITCSNAKVWI